MEEENINLKEQIKKLNESIESLAPKDKQKDKKPKLFKLPSRARISKMRVKDNWVTVMKINENKNVDFIKEKIQDQTIMVDGVPRLATGEDVLNYKGKPIMVLPSWSVKPFTPSENYNKSLLDGSNTAGYSLLLATMKSGAINAKKKLSIALIIGGLVILTVIGYVIFKG